MSGPPSLAPVTLWSIQTRTSVVSCELVHSPDGRFELHLKQSDEVVVTQPFLDEESLRGYADALRERLSPLANVESTDGHPDRKAS